MARRFFERGADASTVALLSPLVMLAFALAQASCGDAVRQEEIKRPPSIPCDLVDEFNSVPLPEDAPRCGDGVIGRHVLSCAERSTSGCGTKPPKPTTCCGGIVEHCDGETLGGKSCADLGYARGELVCRDCFYDVSACRRCASSDGVACGDTPGRRVEFAAVVGGEMMLATDQNADGALELHAVEIEGHVVRWRFIREIEALRRLVVADGALWTYWIEGDQTYIERLDGTPNTTVRAACKVSVVARSDRDRWLGKLRSSSHWRVIDPSSGRCGLPQQTHVATTGRGERITLMRAGVPVAINGKTWPRLLDESRGPFVLSVKETGAVTFQHGGHMLYFGPPPVSIEVGGQDHRVERIERGASPFQQPDEPTLTRSLETDTGRLWIASSSFSDANARLRPHMGAHGEEADVELQTKWGGNACSWQEPSAPRLAASELAFVRKPSPP